MPEKTYESRVADLDAEDIESVAGARMKEPGLHTIAVYYDDGINILTSDPSRSNVVVSYI
jgi:hypothetical protein